MPDYGYAGKILDVNLNSRRTAHLRTADCAEKFVGGRGLAARLYWEKVPPKAGALSADNALVFATGPVAGVPGFCGSRWLICGKSPAAMPERFSSSNLGGDWGIRLKSAGYDALMIQGQLDRPGYLLVQDGKIEMRDASSLWGKGAIDTVKALQREFGEEAGVVTIGPAGENLVVQATTLADNEAVGCAGLGAVMGAKKLKAIVVNSVRRRTEVAQPDRVKELAAHFKRLGKETVSRTGNVVVRIDGPQTKRAPCWGCSGLCLRRVYRSNSGQEGKFMCDAAAFYQPWAELHYGPGHEVPFHATKLCDNYGLDTMTISMIIVWLRRCHRAGILTDEIAGIPLSKVGTVEFIDTLVRKIALREGFGNILAHGIEEAARSVGHGAWELIQNDLSVAGLPGINDPRLYVTTALLYAGEPRPPLGSVQELSRVGHQFEEYMEGHEGAYMSGDVVRLIARRFWGSEAAGDLSNFEGKPLAAAMIQDRQHAKDCLVLCGFIWPVLDAPHAPGYVGTIDLESSILSAVTGKAFDPEGLRLAGERVFNLNRAILVREGHRGREDDRLPEVWHTKPLKGNVSNLKCMVPGKGGQPAYRKGAVIDRHEFACAQSEYYRIRNWSDSGYQTGPMLEDLGLGDVARDLAERSLTPS